MKTIVILIQMEEKLSKVALEQLSKSMAERCRDALLKSALNAWGVPHPVVLEIGATQALKALSPYIKS